MLNSTEGNKIEIVNRTFEFLNQYPKIEDYAIEYEGGIYRTKTYKSGEHNTLEETIAQALRYVADIIEKSDRIWLRVFPELREGEGKYWIRLRMAHRDRKEKNEDLVIEKLDIAKENEDLKLEIRVFAETIQAFKEMEIRQKIAKLLLAE